MTKPRLHTVPIRFSLRIDKRMNDYYAEWAKSEGMSKERLMEQQLGLAARKRIDSQERETLV